MQMSVHTTPWRDRPTLRIAEAAELIGVSERHISRMVDSGELEGRRAGTVPLIVTSSLVAWEQGKDANEPQEIKVKPEVQKAASRWSKDMREV